jgi:hypothetical protein
MLAEESTRHPRMNKTDIFRITVITIAYITQLSLQGKRRKNDLLGAGGMVPLGHVSDPWLKG